MKSYGLNEFDPSYHLATPQMTKFIKVIYFRRIILLNLHI